MPTYEYLCPHGHLFEEFQSISSAPKAICPECGAEAERKISAGSGLIFKGSGFYITDYKGSKNASTDVGTDSKKSAATPAEPTKPADSKSSESNSTSEVKPKDKST